MATNIPPAQQYANLCICNTRDILTCRIKTYLKIMRTIQMFAESAMLLQAVVKRLLPLLGSRGQRWRHIHIGQGLLTDTFMPATLSRLDVVEKAPVVHSYLTNGFIIRNSVVYGSVGLLPRGFFNWKVRSVLWRERN